MSGALVVVATPIGNLGDLSPRAAAALRDADAIACEDTRHTRTLLSAQSITGKRLLAVHEHNERDAAAGLLQLAAQGQRIALVTDAGQPGVSDPGSVVINAFIDAGVTVECVPGPTAFVLALVLSGLSTDRFVFEGFLPAKGATRTERLQEVAAERRTTVLYEAPHRISKTVSELVQHAGGARRVALCRELTKRFEEVWRGTLAEAVEHLSATEPRGEFVVVLEGASAVVTPPAQPSDAEIRARIDALKDAGLRTRDAVDAVVAETGLQRRVVYDIAVRPS